MIVWGAIDGIGYGLSILSTLNFRGGILSLGLRLSAAFEEFAGLACNVLLVLAGVLALKRSRWAIATFVAGEAIWLCLLLVSQGDFLVMTVSNLASMSGSGMLWETIYYMLRQGTAAVSPFVIGVGSICMACTSTIQRYFNWSS
jgi:hypothetical protein